MDFSKRKLQRLRGYDYNQNGYYFITLCTQDKQHLFGSVVEGNMVLNDSGRIAQRHIEAINRLYEGIAADQYVIMPNHIHMILILCRECISCIPQNDPTKSQISKIVQAYKSVVTKEIRGRMDNGTLESCGTHKMRSLRGIWQKSYYDHVIRDEEDYERIGQYIDTNPAKWELDKYYSKLQR